MSGPQANAQVTLSLPILRRGQHSGEPPVERLQFMLNFVKGADDLAQGFRSSSPGNSPRKHIPA